MNRNMQLAFILLAISTVFADDHPYCLLSSCPNRTNTFCQYPEAGAALTCGKLVRSGLLDYEKEIVLNLYNNNGSSELLEEEKSSNSLSPVRLFEWDDELEQIAQRWADQCNDGFDDCRNVDRFLVRQQAGILFAPNYEVRPSIYPLISKWFCEDGLNNHQDFIDYIRNKLNNLNTKDASETEDSDTSVNCLTPFLKKKENRIGCGAIRSVDLMNHRLYLVCNFGREI